MARYLSNRGGSLHLQIWENNFLLFAIPKAVCLYLQLYFDCDYE